MDCLFEKLRLTITFGAAHNLGFLLIASCGISLSSESSAASFSGLSFSSSRRFSWLISDEKGPPHFLGQLQYVASEIPGDWHASAIAAPSSA